MTTITCDRCAATIAGADPYTVELARGKQTDEERELLATYDLCGDCFREVRAAVEPTPGPPPTTTTGGITYNPTTRQFDVR